MRKRYINFVLTYFHNSSKKEHITKYSIKSTINSTVYHRVHNSRIDTDRGKSGPALGGTEYRLMPSACRLIVRAKL